MRGLLIFLLLAASLVGCARPVPPVPPPPAEAPKSLTHIAETNKLRIGMHESEVFEILGPPVRRESGFNNGYRLWFSLYDPRYGVTLPSSYLVSTDRNGYVTFLSSNGLASDNCPCPCP